MIIYKNRDAAEEAKRTNSQYRTSDMTVKVDGGFAVMSAKDYLGWLMSHLKKAGEEA